MNSNSKILSAIAIVLALVILGSEVWERRANSGETLLSPNSPQINITPNEKPAPDAVPDEEAIPDETTPEVKPEPINPQQPKRRFIIPRSSPRSSGGCAPGGGCSPSGGEMYYESSSYYGCSPGYSYGYSYGGCSPSYGRCR